MRILLASSEVVPFAKTGGLADVCGALPVELAQLGHSVSVILPAYRHAKKSGLPIEPLGIEFDIPIGSRIVHGRLLKSLLPRADVVVYLVEQDGYYDRPELYRENGVDYKDNCERFVFFCRAVLESIRQLGRPVDVIHCNDWQTGLIPAYLKIEYGSVPGFEEIGTLMTLHNLAYQGQFWHWDMLLTGLDWKYFNWHQMEFYGHLNLLKTGIVFADILNTVSPTYALEIQRSPLGCGLEGVLQNRAEDLYGIINGVDYATWNPQRDPHLPKTYDVDCWRAGKGAAKADLQAELGLPVLPSVPLIGMIGRLVDQKGFDLVAQIIEHWASSSDAQWVILGAGEPSYQQLLRRLSQEYPGKVACRMEFSDRLAHRIEAASDIFLMPSRFEPCGLNQLYSLKYGAVPVVHSTGGLADTIVDCNESSLREGTANGFAFYRYDVSSLEDALGRACEMYRREPDLWARLVETGMRQDWSWSASARQYVELYEKALARARASHSVCA